MVLLDLRVKCLDEVVDVIGIDADLLGRRALFGPLGGSVPFRLYGSELGGSHRRHDKSVSVLRIIAR
jgi:hypothetical protein